MVYVYIALLALNFLCFYLKKRSKILVYISYFVIILFMAGNAEGPDLAGYILDYNSEAAQRLIADLGYGVLEDFFGKFLGLGFVSFRIIMCTISFNLIDNTLKFFDLNKHLVIASYLSYLMFIDTVQIRNFLAQAILVFAIQFLIQDGKKNIIKFILYILLASTIQISFFFYMILLVFKLKNKRLINRLLILFGIGSFLLSYLTKQNIYGEIIQLFIGDRGAGYFSTQTRFSWLGVLVLFAYSVAILYFLRLNYKKLDVDVKYRLYVDYLWKINGALVLTLPLLLSNYNFYRFIRSVLIINYIGYEILLNKYNRRNAKYLGIIFLIILLNGGWFVLDYIIANGLDRVVVPVFENNYFWGIDRVYDLRRLLFY